jgi:hypothetical protein
MGMRDFYEPISLLMVPDIPEVIPSKSQPQPPARPNLDPDVPNDDNEEGEEMDVGNDEDAAMMSLMGMAGFGSTKVLTLMSCETVSYESFCTGKASRRQPRRCCPAEESKDVAPIYE